MSRVGKAPIQLPQGVDINVSKSNVVTVKGPKGQLQQQIDPDLTLDMNDGTLEVKRPTDQKRHREVHGLYRALINNMVTGVTEGFVREMEIFGVGFRASNNGQWLELSLGYSHPILFLIPQEIKVETRQDKGQNPIIKLQGIDKELLGQVCAKIRGFRKPEPYKGKGIRFVGEAIRRKAGKTSGKK
ncbi:50S ribosomal protein L6 [Haliscomenobacter hydrossis]|uniref:Large ribosomal subunit protein uL6 n=1 Tax=Haliscomenobacter hydrossis (strain ATCC 27775 / DSM 1100 / LMG 10767 / O) TaxID=760192 RepID=F4KWV8_HALH1|nr:50S ribosomal protein L6 [Haliscomenobacter hydrossis]AEE52591.1 ribosomal protein L6 [Haliscomenobacter hydrossis DSM 1100]